jgi:hypothetical protein
MMNKKIFLVLMMIIFGFVLMACQEEEITKEVEVDNTYLLLMEAEDLSGMTEKTKVVISTGGSLNLPTLYKGVTITYTSRNEDIISNEGIVTLPNTCWIESRDQQGISQDEFEGLNDNWPVVLDVLLSLNGQTRSAKLLFVVAPAEGYTCDKYLG